MENSLPQALPEVHAPLPAGDVRLWGSITSIGTTHGKIAANFTAQGATSYATVLIPTHLEQLALIALRQGMKVLASFDGPLSSGPARQFVGMTDLVIYN